MNAELSYSLLGKDLSPTKRNKLVLERIQNQHAFDELFSFLFHHERPLVLRAADAIEKITKTHPEFSRHPQRTNFQITTECRSY